MTTTPFNIFRTAREYLVFNHCLQTELPLDTLAEAQQEPLFTCIEAIQDPQCQRLIEQLNTVLAQREHFRALEARRVATSAMLAVIRENPTSALAAKFALALYKGSKPPTSRAESASARGKSARTPTTQTPNRTSNETTDPIEAAHAAIAAANAVIQEHTQRQADQQTPQPSAQQARVPQSSVPQPATPSISAAPAASTHTQTEPASKQAIELEVCANITEPATCEPRAESAEPSAASHPHMPEASDASPAAASPTHAPQSNQPPARTNTAASSALPSPTSITPRDPQSHSAPNLPQHQEAPPPRQEIAQAA